MITIIIRAILVYVLLLFVFRLMGKRQLAQMQPFEFVLTLIIADLATIPMAEISVPALHGIVPLLTLVLMHFIITILATKSQKFSKIISGKPIIVVNSKGIDYTALKTLNISVSDLLEAVRSSGYFSLEEVLYAIVETNGTVTVMPKAQKSPVSNEDLKIEKQESSLPVMIIEDGKYNTDNLKVVTKTKEFFDDILKTNNIKKVSDVLILTIDNTGSIYLQKKDAPSKVINLNLDKVCKYE